jgi:hypothetical protein
VKVPIFWSARECLPAMRRRLRVLTSSRGPAAPLRRARGELRRRDRDREPGRDEGAHLSPAPLSARAPDGARAQFVGYYVKDGRVIAVSSMQNDPLAIKASELFRLGRFPSADAIRAGKNILEIDISSTKAGNTA